MPLKESGFIGGLILFSNKNFYEHDALRWLFSLTAIRVFLMGYAATILALQMGIYPLHGQHPAQKKYFTNSQ